MKLRYFPVNAAWGFTFGKDIRKASIITMCKTKRRLFSSRDEAVWEAERCGLEVDKRGNVKVHREDVVKSRRPLLPSEVKKAMKVDKGLNGRRRRGR